MCVDSWQKTANLLKATDGMVWYREHSAYLPMFVYKH